MTNWISSNDIRSRFSALMSEMYQNEVPLYGDLMDLVKDINQITLEQQPNLQKQLQHTGELPRLSQERHGAIRLGTAEELSNMRRIFAVMGMYPVGYYDLVPAGVPVHSTAFRAIDSADLNHCPFRVFTSLLRLELMQDPELRILAEQALAKRQIFTDRALELTTKFEQQGGLDEQDVQSFVEQVLETFRWHTDAPVSKSLYQALHDQHRLIADVVAFKGPHINHLTPRTLDIDAVQDSMSSRGITPKAVVEGPPRRECPILLRQTSFKALQEKVNFNDEDMVEQGSHTARFGEIEQRGLALSPTGRALYDQLLQQARTRLGATPDESNAADYVRILAEEFQAFPDRYIDLHDQELGYFYYFLQQKPAQASSSIYTEQDIPALVANGTLSIEPIVYEDFLPVSAAGIFQSNLGEGSQSDYASVSNQDLFEQSLGAQVFDEMKLYQSLQQKSLQACLDQLNAA
ncbi:putative glyoxalase superfamily metalloenzyme YdcJ [Acinetobacter calcoaceticus]|uniref:2-oxoadipate dioxygenase/decarboxylase n=1 Tax=Acinetobacter calcoaceticus TaxID=471 RepID=A0A4R1XSG8_ACICA|nr:putative glyoxalase superfamily metalloenzyme YdcJ [Acinetobacter calcoaceticus]